MKNLTAKQIVVFLMLIAAGGALAAPARKVLNVVNFVRALDPRMPKAEYVRALDEEVKLNRKYGFKNTVLLQYDALVDAEMLATARKSDPAKTEFGFWFEMSRPLNEAAGLPWKPTAKHKDWNWDWFINPGFLMAYDHDGRRRLVDAAFAKFRELFGHYPKSVGSWLLDAYSMDYMVEKYGVDGFCICREQDNTDAYGLRGGYSNGAYYPSKRNMLSAAVDMKNAVRSPVFKMLTPDPIHNYGNPDRLYPDYPYKTGCATLEPVWNTGFEPRIVDWFFRVYTEPKGLLNLSYMQAGQENSFGWRNISKGWPMQCAKIAAEAAAGRLVVETMGETARRFKADHPANCPQTQVALEDWNGNRRKSIWYNSRFYRANLILDGGRLVFRDIHKMADDFEEPFLDKVCTGWQALYFTPPVVDQWLFRDKGVSGTLAFDGAFASLAAEPTPTDGLVVTAVRPTGERVTVRFDEDRITVKGTGLSAEYARAFREKMSIGANALGFDFSGYRYRVPVTGELTATERGYRLTGDEVVLDLAGSCVRGQSSDLRVDGRLAVVRNEAGAITNLSIAGDAHRMNWVHSADNRQYKWIGPEYAWGTGTVKIDGGKKAWLKPGVIADGLEMKVESRLEADGTLYERREFVNVSNRTLSLSEIDIHTPFNDNYPRIPGEMYARRCHAHVWAGGNAAWVCAMRIGGETPNLGLAVVEGAVSAFELKERARDKDYSNTRGIIALSPPDATLAPGGRTAVAWKVFAHGGWEDFFRKVVALGGVDVRAERYVLKVGERTRLTATTAAGSVSREWVCDKPGEQRASIACADGRTAWVELLGVADPDALLLARARYIVKHQQVDAPGTPYDGALVPYDTETGRQQLAWKDKTLTIDHSEGGERMGMGVFLALMAQRGHRDEFLPALIRYHRFCRQSLQSEDYSSWQCVDHTSRVRAFNYPWFIRFYLEMHALTGERRYLEDAYGTFKRLFRGDIKIPDVLVAFPLGQALRAFRREGMKTEADDLVSWGRSFLSGVAGTCEKRPSQEVNIAPEGVSGAINGLLDFAELTGDPPYREAARRWIRLAEAICGRQPSWHAHDIGLHHWDGYWFGKRECWGDTLPHDWNGDMAIAFRRYAEMFGEKAYAERAAGIANAMLGLFTPDGRGSCAYIFPDRVNGSPGKFFDPLANDQDWALVFYLMACDGH